MPGAWAVILTKTASDKEREVSVSLERDRTRGGNWSDDSAHRRSSRPGSRSPCPSSTLPQTSQAGSCEGAAARTTMGGGSSMAGGPVERAGTGRTTRPTRAPCPRRTATDGTGDRLGQFRSRIASERGCAPEERTYELDRLCSDVCPRGRPNRKGVSLRALPRRPARPSKRLTDVPLPWLLPSPRWPVVVVVADEHASELGVDGVELCRPALWVRLHSEVDVALDGVRRGEDVARRVREGEGHHRSHGGECERGGM